MASAQWKNQNPPSPSSRTPTLEEEGTAFRKGCQEKQIPRANSGRFGMTVLWRVDLFRLEAVPVHKESERRVMSTNLDSPAACFLYQELFDAAEAAATIFFG